MIEIKRIKRIAVEVKDLEKSVETFKKLFGIQPFHHGIEPEEKYWWTAFKLGEGDCTMEFLSPWHDPEGEMLIGRFIKKRGEGLYMVTLETEGSGDAVLAQLKETGIKPSWGEKSWENIGEHASWTEHYIAPKDACGVLFTLASLVAKVPEVEEYGAGKTVIY